MNLNKFFKEVNELKEYDINKREPINSFIDIFKLIIEKLYNTHPEYIGEYYIVCCPRQYVHLKTYQLKQTVHVKLASKNELSIVLDVLCSIFNNDKHSEGYIGATNIYVLGDGHQGILSPPLLSASFPKDIDNIDRDKVVNDFIDKIEKEFKN